VLVKALLPPFWGVPFSVANLYPLFSGESLVPLQLGASPDANLSHDMNLPVLFTLWLGGALSFWGVMLYRYVWAVRLLGKGRIVETGPLRKTHDDLCGRLGVRSRPQVVLSNAVGSPFLWGVFRPSIALPAEFPGEVSSEELESVLLHELTHWKRGDIFMTQLELFVMGIFWFHPLVWMTVSTLRRERESACDEAVLATGCIEAKRYGDSLVNVLEFVRDRSPLPATFFGEPCLGLTGTLERKTQLHKRLEEIMTQRNHVRKVGLFGWILLLFFAACVLPMAIADGETDETGEKPREMLIVPSLPSPQTTEPRDTVCYQILLVKSVSNVEEDVSFDYRWPPRDFVHERHDDHEVLFSMSFGTFCGQPYFSLFFRT
jgi:beta-lactamase regulating signal transducer with metallopeptidase domain